MPHHRTQPKTFKHSIELRHNLTDAEQKLWQLIRSNRLDGVHFRRQHAVRPYIVDFCAPQEGLVIELDGGQHLEQEAYDGRRTAYLSRKGYRVLRFWNNEVLTNIDVVIQVIADALSPEKDN